LGRDGIEPSTSGLKVQASHQHAHPTTCRHNDLVVRSRGAWWHFGAASVPIVCQSAGRYSLAPRHRLLGGQATSKNARAWSRTLARTVAAGSPWATSTATSSSTVAAALPRTFRVLTADTR